MPSTPSRRVHVPVSSSPRTPSSRGTSSLWTPPTTPSARETPTRSFHLYRSGPPGKSSSHHGQASMDGNFSERDDESQDTPGYGVGINELTGVIKTALDGSGLTQDIEEGIDHFLEGSRLLMGALDEVQTLHPFVGVVIIAFKAIYTLEMTRRENNHMIVALHVAIYDMMAVIAELKNVTTADAQKKDNKGNSIKSRIEVLATSTKNDMKRCENACNSYEKTHCVVRFLKGPRWKQELHSFVELFKQRREKFLEELAIHTALVSNNLVALAEKNSAKSDRIMEVLSKLVPPEENKFKEIIEKYGTDEPELNDQCLQELNDLDQEGKSANTSQERGARLSKLKDDLKLDPSDVMERNELIFGRRWDLRVKQIQKAMEGFVHREGDRIISAINSGPHEKLKDNDMHKLWKLMGWRGSVKTHRFAMALRDYFHESWHSDVERELSPATEHQDKQAHSGTFEVADRSTTSSEGLVVAEKERTDGWALTHINISRLQAIGEAFDDDGTGFVTVAEVNTFTVYRPKEWSIEHWIAYWAIGWHQSLYEYQYKIREVIAKIFAILPSVLPANRAFVNTYIVDVYQAVTTVESSVNPCYINKALQAKFKSYVKAEEARLEENLDLVRYDIDEATTVKIVTGPGRIEKFILPLLYLILKRHSNIIRICRMRNVHPKELVDAASTINCVIEAFKKRFNVLCSSFGHQRLKLKRHFEIFSHGLFKYLYDPSGLWALANVKDAEFLDYPYDERLETTIGDDDVTNILNYPVGIGHEDLDFSAYDPLSPLPRPLPSASSPSLELILGLWNGFKYRRASSKVPNEGMVSFILRPYQGQGRTFQASGRCNSKKFEINGECSFDATHGFLRVKFQRKFLAGGSNHLQHWVGALNTNSDIGTLTGTWGLDPDPTTHRGKFVLKRLAPDLLCFRPAPSEFSKNKARTLWYFVFSAVQYQTRHQSWSVSFFKKRMENRKKFINLYLRRTDFNTPVDDMETSEFLHVRQRLTAADSQFFRSLADFKLKRTIGYIVFCASCEEPIFGARIICLVCEGKHTWRSFDLCEAEDCAKDVIDGEHWKGPHLPTHDVVKVRRVVHLREFADLHCDANRGLDRARAAFGPGSSPKLNPETTDGEQSSEDNDTPPNRDKEDGGVTCAICREDITRPCWYCVKCEDNTFICNDCDSKGAAPFREHDDTHDLVRCPEPQVGAEPSVKAQFSDLSERLDSIESKMNSRFSKVEKLLKVVLANRRGRADLENGNAGNKRR